MPQYAFDVGDFNLPGTGYLPTAAFSIPVMDGLAGAYLLGGGEEHGLINWADEDRSLTTVGTPAWEDGHAVLSAANYLDTGIAETPAMTLVVIGRRTSAVNTAFVGNYRDQTNIGIALYAQTANQNIVANADRGSGGGSVQVAGNTDQLRLYSLTVPASGAMTIRDHTAGTSATGTQTGARVVETADTIRIGSFPGVGFPGVAHVSAALVFTRALTIPELAEVEAWGKEVGAFYGLVI